MQIHTVQSGETLFSIASRYGVDASVLAFNNDVADPLRLPVGQPIAIVEPIITHIVQEGETLFSIAARYGVTENDIYRANLFLNGLPTVNIGLMSRCCRR